MNYGNKRDYPKIDLYYLGDYYGTTTWSKTCKDAVKHCLESIETSTHQLGGIGLVDSQILKNPTYLKARFQK